MKLLTLVPFIHGLSIGLRSSIFRHAKEFFTGPTSGSELLTNLHNFVKQNWKTHEPSKPQKPTANQVCGSTLLIKKHTLIEYGECDYVLCKEVLSAEEDDYVLGLVNCNSTPRRVLFRFSKEGKSLMLKQS
jgi:hypothetical protein